MFSKEKLFQYNCNDIYVYPMLLDKTIIVKLEIQKSNITDNELK